MADRTAPERPVHAEDHMTDFEALMWTLDKDPRLSATMANLTILDRPPDRRRLRARLERATLAVPRLRQRVRRGFGRLAPPRWSTDPDFDLDHHLRWRTMGGDASTEDLRAAAVQIAADPFDRTRPMWEFTVVEGLAGGRAAMVQKLHHTLTDGEGSLRISEQFVDFERTAPDPPPFPGPPPAPSDEPDLLSTMGDTAAHLWRRGTTTTRHAVGDVAGSLRHPSTGVRRSREVVDLAISAVRQARFDQSPASPLWTARSLRRWFGTLEVELDAVRRVAADHGVSVNDVFVAGAADGAGRYHRDRDAAVDHLRMAMPISRRRDGSAGGNMFGLSQSDVPTGGLAAADRLAAVHSTMHRAKSEPVVGAMEALAGWANLLPTSVLVRAGYRLASSVDFTTSNLRAAPFDVYIGGALMEANYPIGPLFGTAFNLTTMSYRGTLYMGLIVDAGAVAEPESLRDSIEGAFLDLVGG